jgi:hypothetical protein
MKPQMSTKVSFQTQTLLLDQPASYVWYSRLKMCFSTLLNTITLSLLLLQLIKCSNFHILLVHQLLCKDCITFLAFTY